ncbi:hypothetical protein [Limnohabitans sp. Rim8]|uniref:hypothetical protein n=1 Tax=Limnohabitans sp. Rim8 TaxID=1100718 RepID=UPI00262FDB8D|nr:hypothetical protein [Limnohabitans sp. Rim8]
MAAINTLPLAYLLGFWLMLLPLTLTLECLFLAIHNGLQLREPDLLKCEWLGGFGELAQAQASSLAIAQTRWSCTPPLLNAMTMRSTHRVVATKQPLY